MISSSEMKNPELRAVLSFSFLSFLSGAKVIAGYSSLRRVVLPETDVPFLCYLTCALSSVREMPVGFLSLGRSGYEDHAQLPVGGRKRKYHRIRMKTQFPPYCYIRVTFLISALNHIKRGDIIQDLLP